LNLPQTVVDLTAIRAAESVTLNWTMPRKNTDHLLLKGSISATICWREGMGDCQPVGQTTENPEAKTEYVAQLPRELTIGRPRQISLFVELKNPKGRSAGLSNPAIVLAGAAPGSVKGLTAQVRADGVALHWEPESGQGVPAHIRLHRTLLTPASPKPRDAGKGDALTSSAEPVLRDLMVDPPSTGSTIGAVDGTARFGQVYQYTAQRILFVDAPDNDIAVTKAGTKASATVLELPGEVSAPVRAETVDLFPPAIPRGLVAVYVPEEKTVDLSWDPNTEVDLAGYIVYRAEGDSADWQRISGPQALVGSAFRDSAIALGHTYRFAVSAIDQTGNESKRSVEAQETVPNP
jgi:hypothetical protein